MKTWRIYMLLSFTVTTFVLLTVLTWHYSEGNIFLVAIGTVGITALVLTAVSVQSIFQLVKKSVQLIVGNTELSADAALLPQLIENNNQKFRRVSEHIKQMGSVKDMPAVHESLLNDEVGQALQAVQVQMITMKEEEDKQHWITEGLAKFSEVLRKKESIKEYSAHIISTLVKYVGANQGGLFLEYEHAEEGRYLELTGSYAYDKRRYQEKKIFPGEGILGQCMYEKDTIYITDVPKDYVQITSGLGLATPRNIVVVPLIMNEQFYGAFELASFEILQPHKIEFLEKVAVMIASEIGAIKTLEHTKSLLAESDELSHKLQAHEEEMRMNMEELAATQEEMRRHQVELEKKQAELGSYLSAIDNTIASAEFTLAGTLSNANNLFLTITGFSFNELKNKSYTDIFNDDQSLHLMWENLQLGKFFSGEFRMHDQDGKELWLNGTLNPILDSAGQPEKIMLFAQFTTQEKEKLNDLGGMVQALKQTLPVLEVTTDFQCKSANEKFMKLFGVSRVNLKNHTLCDFMPSKKFCDEFLKHQNDLVNANQVKMVLDFEMGGKVHSWEVSFSVIRDLSGKINRIVMMMVHEVDSKVVRLAM